MESTRQVLGALHGTALQVGDWRVEPSEQRITNGRQVHHLEPRIMQVLVVLAERPGTVVPRDDVLDAVWGDVVVNEEALTRAVSDLRKLLGDDSADPRYIETVRGVGYRLVAPVAFLDEGEDPGSAPARRAEPRTASRRVRYPWVLGGVLVGLLLGLAGWALLEGDSGTTSPAVLTTVPFTSYPGFERDPALSPDGSRVAYGWGEDAWEEEFDLYVKQRNTETPLRLTDFPGYESNPAWSPDGSAIAFAHLGPEGQAALYTVPSIGGPARKLIDAASWVYGLDWSPAGEALVFAERAERSRHGFRLVRLALATLERVPLTTPVASESDHSPVYSPDGQIIAFIRATPMGYGDVYLLPLENGTPRRLTYRQTRILGIDWADDGRSLLVLTHHPGATRLWRVAVEDGALEQLPTTGRNMVSVSATADRLVFEEATQRADVWQFSLEEDGAPRPFMHSTQWDGEPAFSPNGRRVAFASARSGDVELWIAGRDGQNPVQLTHFGGTPVARPRWSPDGQHIAFYAAEEGTGALYVIPAEGGKTERRSEAGKNALVTGWSRDGAWIYFASDRSGNWQLWKLPAMGGEAVQVTTHGGFSAHESPDGVYLYYTKIDADGLWRRPLAGGPEKRFADRPMRWAWGSWGVLGDGVYYIDVQDGRQVVMHRAFKTGAMRVLAPLPERSFHPRVTASPDGTTLLFAEEKATGSDLTLVANP